MRRDAWAVQQARGPTGPLVSQIPPSGGNVSAGLRGSSWPNSKPTTHVLPLIRGLVLWALGTSQTRSTAERLLCYGYCLRDSLQFKHPANPCPHNSPSTPVRTERLSVGNFHLGLFLYFFIVAISLLDSHQFTHHFYLLLEIEEEPVTNQHSSKAVPECPGRSVTHSQLST